MTDQGAYGDLDRPALDVRALRHALRAGRPGTFWRDVRVVETTESTNADLAARARTACDAVDARGGASVLVAEHQRAGRGRLGRRWQAPPRSALTVSVLVHPRVEAARWPWLPLLTGVAVTEAVRQTTRLDASVKWPNDVLVDGRKVAGVLLERVDASSGGRSRAPAAVLGIGLNVSATRAELPVATATSLALERAATTDRQTILVALLRALEALYAAWAQDRGDSRTGLQASYVRRCVTLGQQVRVELPDGTAVTGRADTVDAHGRLVLATPAGRRVMGAGDVVHVRPHAGGAF